MLSTLRYAIYYAMSCILFLRFFHHCVIMERTGSFFTCVIFFLLFSRELAILKTVLYNREDNRRKLNVPLHICVLC